MKKKISFLIALISNFLVFTEAQASGFTFLSQLEHKLHVPEHVLTLCLVTLLLAVFGLLYRVRIQAVPNTIIPDDSFSLRSLFESMGQMIYDQCKSIIGEKEGPKYFSFVVFVFFYILLNNFIGLIPGFLPPTENLNTTLALGLISFVYYNFHGCKEQGTWNYIKHFAGPLWYMAFLIFPLEIISNFVRPLSLALRLRGNIFGDHLALGIFSELVPYFIPILFMLLGILVSIVQAFVFTILSMVYIGLAVAHHDHD